MRPAGPCSSTPSSERSSPDAALDVVVDALGTRMRPIARDLVGVKSEAGRSTPYPQVLTCGNVANRVGVGLELSDRRWHLVPTCGGSGARQSLRCRPAAGRSGSR